MSEDQWRDRAQTAEATLLTQKEGFARAIDKVKAFKTNFGIREKSDGQIEIDWDKFVDNIGLEGAFELRKIIDEKYNISGEAGEKPRIKMTG